MSLKEFDPKLKLKNYLSEGDYKRSQIRILTNNLDLIANKISLGWSFYMHERGFLLIAPEKWIVDLSEPFKASFYTNSLNTNFAYYNFIKDQIKKGLLQKKIHNILGSKSNIFFLSKGPALETEIRIILNDKKIGDVISKILFTSFFEDNSYKDYIGRADHFLGRTRKLKIQRCKSINSYPKKIRYLFREIKNNYSLINVSKKDLFSYDYAPEISKQIDKEFESADVFIFIPWGCFKYLSSIITERMVDRTMFWEIHFSKHNRHTHRFRHKNLKGKKVIILDKAYTGSTIDKLAKLVKKEGGYPIKVALFPKSILALKRADYIVFLDKLIKVSEIDSLGPYWFKNLYKKISRLSKVKK
jgi:hypothetical protein